MYAKEDKLRIKNKLETYDRLSCRRKYFSVYGGWLCEYEEHYLHVKNMSNTYIEFNGSLIEYSRAHVTLFYFISST